MAKLKLAMYWAGSCGGCDISVLEIHEKWLQLLEQADVVFWPCVLDAKVRDVEALADEEIDVCLLNGCMCTTENVEMARLLRRKSKVLMAYGACAMLGGVPALRNLASRLDTLDRIYRTAESTYEPGARMPQPVSELPGGVRLELPEMLAEVAPLRDVVTVDYSVPGCPPAADRTWEVLEAIVEGRLPERGTVLGAGDKSVCDECPLRKDETKISAFKRYVDTIPDPDRCLLEQGLCCSGPATRSGCGAQCLVGLYPCRGCYGPTGEATDQGTSMIGVLGALREAKDEAGIGPQAGALADPVGTLYRFGLASSLLAGLGRKPSTGEGSE